MIDRSDGTVKLNEMRNLFSLRRVKHLRLYHLLRLRATGYELLNFVGSPSVAAATGKLDSRSSIAGNRLGTFEGM